MAAALGKFFYTHLRIRGDVARANLKLCFPEKSENELENILEKSYVNIATVLFEFLYFPKFTRENLKNVVEFSDESRRMIESGLERGRGLILISGHFSNWELVALAIGAFSTKQFSIIVHPFHNKAADKFANKYRALLGNSTVPMANSIRASLSSLRANGIIALLADQSAAKESVPAKFFGIDVPTFQGPSSFALRTHAAVQIGFVIRKQDGTYRLDLREIDYTDLKDDSEENIMELTQRHVSVLEEYIRKYPDKWLWFHKRFKHVSLFHDMLQRVKDK
jgi:KDO2-lipid IV(A) lauroyltransferase